MFFIRNHGSQKKVTQYFSSAQAPITKYHRLGGLNNRNLFLTVLETGKSKTKSGSNAHLCPHSIGQNSVTWPYLTSKAVGKCSPAQCLRKHAAGSATGPSLFIFNNSWPLFKLIMTLSILEQKPAFFCPLAGTQIIFPFSFHKPLGHQLGFRVELFSDAATGIHSSVAGKISPPGKRKWTQVEQLTIIDGTGFMGPPNPITWFNPTPVTGQASSLNTDGNYWCL